MEPIPSNPSLTEMTEATRSVMRPLIGFRCIGGVPRTDWAGALLTDAVGYILTGDDRIDEQLPPSYWASRSRNRSPASAKAVR